MALRTLPRGNLDGKLPVSVKCHNLHPFKEDVILCQSIPEKRRISHLHGLALFTFPLNIYERNKHWAYFKKKCNYNKGKRGEYLCKTIKHLIKPYSCKKIP